MVNTVKNVAALDKTQYQTNNFRTLSTNSWNDGDISSKDKHLIAVAIAQATNCKHCLLHHAKAAQDDGASFDEIAEISYLTGVINIAGEQLLQLTSELQLNYNINGRLKAYTSIKTRDFINQQLESKFVDKEIKILALIGIAKFRHNTSLVEHFLTIANAHQINEAKLTEALQVVDILSTGVIYSNNQDIYKFLNN
ncbi:carboxymuconolactone decarboxylase family protein [Providencia burhodogranariea]|uniref:Carboxymuconolactone decarboxylase n=1 Tax=Providencia burhodogranariea DSM 19968 TaxID=1141662 RepID=K8WQQ2_9GAMM|nr:carboxymuconolactone decarboxylase family protein [Providencia burhodogranariea]EKT62943.1 carboxymuconolactone decarboxylase [Providencia burhodogranariea DSM 19968]